MPSLPDIPGQKEIATFPWGSVKDDVIKSRTQPGDLVIPKQVMDANPDIANLAHMAILQQGGLPSNYVAGSPNGYYNPYTGEQHFGWFSSFVRVAVPVAMTMMGMPPLYVAAGSAAATKATGGSNQEALLAGATSYLSSSMSAPATASGGQAAATGMTTNAAGQTVSNAATIAAQDATVNTVGSSLAQTAASGGVSGALAKGAQAAMNWLPDAASTAVNNWGTEALTQTAKNTMIANGVGNLAVGIGAQMAADQMPQQQIYQPMTAAPGAMPTANQMSFLPFAEAINSTTSAANNAAQALASGASITGIPGVNMVNELKNRDTGQTQYSTQGYDAGAFANALSKGRRTGWGQNVVYA